MIVDLHSIMFITGEVSPAVCWRNEKHGRGGEITAYYITWNKNGTNIWTLERDSDACAEQCDSAPKMPNV